MTIGARLKEERKRLGLSQAAFGAIGEVRKESQVNYEFDRRKPDARYLAAIGEAGADVLYILTGKPALGGSPDETELIARYRAAPPQLRAAALAVLGVSAVSSTAAAHEPLAVRS